MKSLASVTFKEIKILLVITKNQLDNKLMALVFEHIRNTHLSSPWQNVGVGGFSLA
jgi:hypothetical protein